MASHGLYGNRGGVSVGLRLLAHSAVSREMIVPVSVRRCDIRTTIALDDDLLGNSARDKGHGVMPTILRVRGYRFYFYSHEPNEPPHVHVDLGPASAKFWLETAAVARNVGYSATQLAEVRRLVVTHRAQLLEAWNVFFGTRH